MNTGLLTKDNEFIPMEYYEIGLFAEQVCKKYQRENAINRAQFEIFAKDYKFFKPYLDFLLFELGYKLVNPLLKENSMWCVENNRLCLKSINKDKYYVPVCDRCLGISYIYPEGAASCMLDREGRIYKINRDIGLDHENVCELVINQYLIYDKDFFEIYQEYMKNGTNNISAFARNMLGFSQMITEPDKSGAVVYCVDFYNTYLENVFKRIKEINPDFIIERYKIHTKESFELATKCIEKVGELNEDRRLRL